MHPLHDKYSIPYHGTLFVAWLLYKREFSYFIVISDNDTWIIITKVYMLCIRGGQPITA